MNIPPFPVRSPKPGVRALPPLRVAVVEHHDMMRRVLVDLLQQATGCEVQAWPHWSQWPGLAGDAAGSSADVLVLDLDGPGRQGAEVCREARASCPHAVVIAVSSRAQTSDRIAALDAGADQLLPKPLSNEELLADIRRLWARLGTQHSGRPAANPITGF